MLLYIEGSGIKRGLNFLFYIKNKQMLFLSAYYICPFHLKKTESRKLNQQILFQN